MGGRCQGVKGHKGVHWCYGLDGTFRWSDNDDDPQEDGCSGTTPPGHKSYVSPVKMAKHQFMSHYEDTVITDKKIIAKLEKDESPEKTACITRPVSAAAAKKFKKLLHKKKK